MLTINFKAIRLLAVLKLLVHLSVFLLGTTRGPRKNGDVEVSFISRILKRWGNPHNILDKRAVILQGRS